MNSQASSNTASPEAFAYGNRVGLQQTGRQKTPENTPTLHAYVMLGAETLYLCHLTMYDMENHSYQIVLKASLPEEAMQKYLRARAQHPKDTFFIGNSERDLKTLPELKSGRRKSFVGNVFHGIPDKPKKAGWPWNGETPLVSEVKVTVEEIVYYRHFDFNIDYPKSLTYILFGSGDEAHMTHYQTKDPDFDQVLSLAGAPDWLSSDQLKAGVHVNIPSLPSFPKDGSSKVYCSNPLTDKQYQVRYQGNEEIPLHQVKIGVHYWFCTKIANGKDPCPHSTTPCASPPPKQ